MTILIIILFILLFFGNIFIPNEGYSPQNRGIVSTIALVLFVVWLIKWSGLL